MKENFSEQKPTVFHFLDYREYLRVFYRFKKNTQPKYSFALFSSKAKIKSPNCLKVVMDGRRNLTTDRVLKFAKALDLNPAETDYWDNLVSLNHSKSVEQKKYY